MSFYCAVDLTKETSPFFITINSDFCQILRLSKTNPERAKILAVALYWRLNNQFSRLRLSRQQYDKYLGCLRRFLNIDNPYPSNPVSRRKNRRISDIPMLNRSFPLKRKSPTFMSFSQIDFGRNFENGAGAYFICTGPYRTSAGLDKLVGLSAYNGRIKTFLLEKKLRGIVVIKSNGLQIIDSHNFFDEKGELKTKEFALFIQRVKQEKLSVFQSHLLVSQGENLFSDSVPHTAYRRMLIVLKNGIFGIFETNHSVSLKEAADMAIKKGALQAVNLDMGPENYCRKNGQNCGRIASLPNERLLFFR